MNIEIILPTACQRTFSDVYKICQGTHKIKDKPFHTQEIPNNAS